MNEWINEDATQRDQYKAERDTLIDDSKVLREKNEKLEGRKRITFRNEHLL